MYQKTQEGDLLPIGWDAARHSAQRLHAIAEAQEKVQQVWAWSPAFLSLIESFVFSTTSARNTSISAQMTDFGNKRMRYYASSEGEAAFELAFLKMTWPRHEVWGAEDVEEPGPPSDNDV
jgi:hypothetical protein